MPTPNNDNDVPLANDVYSKYAKSDATTSTPGAKMTTSTPGATMIMRMLIVTMTKSMTGAMTIGGKERYNQLVLLKTWSYPNEGFIVLLLVT